jgi:hypothetical protein
MLPELRENPDPMIRCQYRVKVLREDPKSAEILKLRQEIKQSQRVQLLLSDRDERGEIPFHPYTKWQGAHWVLTVLADSFLKRRLYRRGSDGEVMRSEFLQMRTPAYWHYDILFGLKVMAEGGWIADPRCGDALDLLESKRLPGSSFAAEGKHYFVNRTPGEKIHAGSRVDWGSADRRKPNEFITLNALYVLCESGRI